MNAELQELTALAFVALVAGMALWRRWRAGRRPKAPACGGCIRSDAGAAAQRPRAVTIPLAIVRSELRRHSPGPSADSS